MKKTLSTLGLVVTGVLLTGLSASAQTFLTSTAYDGHTYELWAGSVPWGVAEADAVADGGYLAVLTTAAETTAVYNGLIGNGFFTQPGSQGNSAWLGATPADGGNSTTDPNNWAWVDGEGWNAFDVGNFAGGEPSGDSDGLTINRYGDSTWNDDSAAGGFIVEINSSSVPDYGSTLALLTGACAMVGTFSRKLRK